MLDACTASPKHSGSRADFIFHAAGRTSTTSRQANRDAQSASDASKAAELTKREEWFDRARNTSRSRVALRITGSRCRQAFSVPSARPVNGAQGSQGGKTASSEALQLACTPGRRRNYEPTQTFGRSGLLEIYWIEQSVTAPPVLDAVCIGRTGLVIRLRSRVRFYEQQ